MSYIISPNRTHDQPDSQNQNGRVQIPSTSYTSYPSPTPSHQHSAFIPDHSTVQLPKVGQIRCCAFLVSIFYILRSLLDRYYDRLFFSPRSVVLFTLNSHSTIDWSLLSADLDFIYLDPVLASHLEDQADLLVGKSLLSFVHPDEQASAKQDLGNVLESRTLHGSVTRYATSHILVLITSY